MPMGTVTSACVAASDGVRSGWSALVAGTHLDRDIRREDATIGKHLLKLGVVRTSGAGVPSLLAEPQ